MHAELSSLTSTVVAAKERVAAMADSVSVERDADLLAALEEVERTLATAARLLQRATRLAHHRRPA